MPRILGYARTSTTDQLAGLLAQQRDLEAAGCNEISTEQVSSVRQRDVLDRVIASIGRGDVLMVTKPDRLARSTEDMLRIVRELEAKGAGLVVLSMGGERLDTRNPSAKLMLTILAAIASWEREIMLERQREGITKAQADGKYANRPSTVRTHTDSVESLVKSGLQSHEIATILGISERSVARARAAAKCRKTDNKSVAGTSLPGTVSTESGLAA